MRSISIALAMLAGLTGAASAQTYPARPVTMIVPFAEGGPTDTIARVVSEHMSKSLGQPVTVQNVPGAGGTTGTAQAAGSKNDGYTIIMGHMGTHGAAPALYPKLKYDPTKDFEPVGMAAGTPIVIVGKKNFPAKDLKEMVAYLKANASTVTNGHAGIGSVSHMSCIMFNSQVGIKPTTVPYSGTGPALNDLMSGQVDYMCDQIVNVANQIKAGSISAYAVALPERSSALPNVPTAIEAGMPKYQVTAWNAVFAPKGTPKEIVEALSAALDKALDDAGTKQRLVDLGAVIPARSERGGPWLGEFVSAEVRRWTAVLKAAE